MAKPAGQGAAKWLRAMTSGMATTNYKASIEATNVNPMELAAQAESLYLANVTEASTSGRRAAKLRATPVSAWKQPALGKGAARLADGATQAQSKVVAHFQKWDPIYAQASAAAKAIPKGGIDAALQRVRAAITVMRQGAGKSV